MRSVKKMVRLQPSATTSTPPRIAGLELPRSWSRLVASSCIRRLTSTSSGTSECTDAGPPERLHCRFVRASVGAVAARQDAGTRRDRLRVRTREFPRWPAADLAPATPRGRYGRGDRPCSQSRWWTPPSSTPPPSPPAPSTARPAGRRCDKGRPFTPDQSRRRGDRASTLPQVHRFSDLLL